LVQIDVDFKDLYAEIEMPLKIAVDIILDMIT